MYRMVFFPVKYRHILVFSVRVKRSTTEALVSLYVLYNSMSSSFSKAFKMFVEKFRALIRNDLFGFASTSQNDFKRFHQRRTRFIFQRNHPCVFGKHVDAHQQVAVAIVKFLQTSLYKRSTPPNPPERFGS